MMMSENSYYDEIKEYTYAELLMEEKEIFKKIIELQYNIVLEETHLNTVVMAPSYRTQLESYRKYLIVLQEYILEKEEELQESEIADLIKNAFESKE